MFEDMHDEYRGHQSHEVGDKPRVEVHALVLVDTGTLMPFINIVTEDMLLKIIIIEGKKYMDF